ncbi:GNAT family N-acetyltransferase [Gorillibacterium sp. CAU 1737]|uniref:GNAT family N-acetyltransferase n=1 Tax=Gorillibacterium sp. CAU 1737 TaxID=3140362 RepID=UPI0032606145
MLPLPSSLRESLWFHLKSLPMNTLFAQAVVEHKAPGAIYVDDDAQPAAYFIVHPYRMSLLTGEPRREAFVREVNRYITNDANQRTQAEWLQIDTPVWREVLPALGSAGPVEEHVRLNFQFQPDLYWRSRQAQQVAAPEASVKIRPLAREEALRFQGAVIPRAFWRPTGEPRIETLGASHVSPDPETAYGVIVDGQLASVAFVAYRSETELEIGIETAPGFQGRGFAYEASAALVENILAQGFQPVWGCREGNVGSLKLATKLGFEPVRRLPYFHLPL